jgi:alkanesulfonate monooxygenase SsuD/methylene tetrahydromethanopterin reductase-like flavin-dependent oxidoreductase (luciferase family)
MIMPGQAPDLHLAVALEGAGWHPAAWREPDARPAELLAARYWADQAAEAERGLLDFVTFEDSLSLPESAAGQVQGRLDAVLTAARIAPLTHHIGLMPTAIVTHTEPFHLSKAIATLDYVSEGRAGVRVKVSANPAEAAHLGRRSLPASNLADGADAAARQLISDLFAEAADYVEVMRRLWDSWEDDAEIRDAATGRFVDRGKLHYIDFEGRWFSVKGPSITPRPPQGQPVVGALAHGSAAYWLAGQAADLAFVTPRDAAHARSLADEIRAARVRAGRATDLHGHARAASRPDPGLAGRRPDRLPPPARCDSPRSRSDHPSRSARVAAARRVPDRIPVSNAPRPAGLVPPGQPVRGHLMPAEEPPL